MANALRVLEFLVDSGDIGVTEASRQLGLSVATAHRMLATLVACGYAEHDAKDRRYRPGNKAVLLGRQAAGRHTLRQIAREHLVRLAGSARETVNLGVIRDGEVLYVDRVLSDEVLHIEVTVGSRVPAYCTAMGKALLAHMPTPALKIYLGGLPRRGSGAIGTVPSAGALRDELAAVATQGFAEDRGQFVPDVSCVAAAVLDRSGQPIAAVSVSAPTSRYLRRRSELITLIVDAVALLNADMRGVSRLVPEL